MDDLGTKTVPNEEDWLKIEPLNLKWRLIKTKRQNYKEEKIRNLIFEAYLEFRNNPKKYEQTFEVFIPKRTWAKTIKNPDLEVYQKIAVDHGGHIADWVELCLIWVSRMNSGESWKKICIEADKSDWYRLIIWKDGKGRLVGNANKIVKRNGPPEADIYPVSFGEGIVVENCVPIIVRKV